MLQLTTADAKRALVSAQSAHARLKHLREKSEAMTESVGRTLETTGAAFALGVVQGAGVFKGGEIFKMPLELLVGLGAHGLRLAGFGGKHGAHLSNIGDGALAAYLNVLGRGIGAQHWGGARTSGSMDGDLSDRLQAIANQA